MAKRKINAAMILAAGKDAHLQTREKVSHAKSINGERFLELNIEEIKNNPMQPRMHIDEEELKDLARSINLHGLIQPIAVIKVGKNDYILKAGQRRWLAHKALGLKKIKAIVQEETILPKEESDKALFEIAIMENTQRDNLNPLELALSLRQAMDKKLYKNMGELAEALSKSKSYVSKIIKILSLEDEIIENLAKNKSTNDIESLYEIQKIQDKQEQIRVYFDFIAKKLDRKALREYNTKKVLLATSKESYVFIKNKKKIKLELDISKFSEIDKKSIEEEMEVILERYYKQETL
jgi:ParB/RepB/Spo0J family partition protein